MHNSARYSDEYINQWGNIFTHYNLRDLLNITFFRFLEKPHHYINQLKKAKK